jgi:hypothetical protein
VSVRPRHTAAGSDTVPLDLGPYHIEIPVAFSPEIGMPGDPRRSRYVFMTIPIERLGLKPPPHLAMHAVANVVASLQRGADDDVRLSRYIGIPFVSPSDTLEGYTGHRLQTAVNLYVAPAPIHPRYIICPWFATNTGPAYPMICNAAETVVSGRADSPDLTVEYVFRQDYWSELPQLSSDLKSLIRSLITQKVP